MFIPVFKNAPNNATKIYDMTGVNCTKITTEIIEPITDATTQGFAYVTADSMETAIKAAQDLNTLYYNTKLYTPFKKSVIRNGMYEHDRIEILHVKLHPVIANGTTFDAENGRFTVLSVANQLVGNVSYPIYEVQGPDGSIMKNVSQNYIMRYTGITLEDTSRRVADVTVGPRAVSSRWTVSLSKDRKHLYCQSPSSRVDNNPFKHIRCIDQFGINVLEFVEAAITRLVIGLMGQVAKEKFLDAEPVNKSKSASCANCKGCRFASISDAQIGDSSNPDIPSRGTFKLKADGSLDNKYVCAYSMQNPGADRIADLNKEQTYGYNTSGFSSAYSEHYRDVALGCPYYHSKNDLYVRNTANEIQVNGTEIVITTAGMQIYFDKGKDNNKPKPTAPVIPELRIVKDDIFNAEEEIIIHQVNCKGVMGAGLAAQIKQRFPKAYKDYKEAFQAGKLKLGDIIISKVSDRSYVIHVCAQDDYAQYHEVVKGTDKVYTDYVALDTALNKVYEFAKKHKLRVAIPYKIGCGLANGDWNIVQKIIAKNLPSAKLYQK